MATINGNNSGNTLNGTNADDIINGLGGNDTINGRGGNDTIDGGSGNDEISGGAGHDAIYGGAGSDYVNGNGGNDRIEGGNGSDELNGGSGLDLLYGGDGNDTLSGGGDADTLFGDIGRDTLGGGAGNDVLVGGAGADWLTGGSGSDTYLYAAVSDSTTAASDILYGFAPGIDRIDVTALLGVTDLLWSDAGPAPNGLWVGQSGGNTFVYADTNGDSTADFRIRVDGLVTLTASDFLGVQSGVTPPVAAADTASVSEDIAPLATGNLLGNDSGTGLAVIAVNFGATAGTVGADLAGDWGVLRLNADGSYTYTLDSSSTVQALAAGQVVQETFTYTASNSGGNATTNLVVTITGTNDAPIAADMSASVSEDVTVNGALAVATDADGDLVGYALAGAPANGTALVNGDGTFSYTPNPSYNGPDSFTYQVSDSNGGSSTYTVSITVDPVNDPAVVSGDVSGSVVEDFVLSTGGVLAVADADSGEAAFVPQVNAAGAYGAFAVDAAGNWSYVLDNASSAVQGLGAGATVTDSFAVSSLDGTGTATVSVTVTGRGDHPPQLTPAVEVFGPTDGIVTTDIGTGHDKGCHVIQQADGKLVVAAYGLNEAGNEDFALIRYHADGSLDTNFGGGDGIVTTPIGTGHDYGRSVIQLDDGKLVVAGFATNSAGFTDFALVRYHADGSLDTTFGGGAGIVTTSVGSQNDEAYTVIQQSDGKLVVAGLAFDATGISNFAMARYNADGSLDASFGGGSGIVSTAVGPSFDFGFTVIQQSDGKLVMVGFAFAGASNFDVALTRYNADGSLDTSFGGGDGIVTTPIGPVYDYAWTVLQQSDGKLVVGAHTLNASGNEDFALIRYNADGSLDAGFGGGDGIVTTAVGPGNDRGFSVVQQADGKLVLAGYALGASGNYDYALVRYNTDGSLDTSFGGGTGIVTTPVSAGDDLGYTATLQSDGKLVIVGLLADGPTHFEVALVRYNPDGSLDTSFGEAGMPDQTVSEGVAFAIGVPANLFTDPDGDAIAYSAALADGNALPSWIAFDATTGLLSGTAPEGAGTIDVRITATDTTGLSTSDTFTISIASVNVPPTAADASLSTSEDVTLNGTLPVATDADGDPVSYALAAPPGNGTALVNANGSFTYTPNPNFNGSDSFLYSVSDGNGGSNAYTVSLTVTPAADPATISGTVSGAVIEDSAPSASGALSVSDPDAGEAAFIPQVATPGTYGSFSLDSYGNWTYLLDNAHPAVQSLPAGGSAIDAFSVSSLDGTATQTVSITIHGTNDAPTLSASVAATLDEDSTANGTAVASDVDTGAALTYSAGAPTAGSVSIDPNSGAWTYTPSADYHGSDGFLISVSDERGALAQQIVSLTITSINDAPAAADAAYSTAEDTPLIATLPVAADADGDALSYSSGDTAPQHGSVLINPDGSFSYTPNPDFNGSDSFLYSVSDGNGGSNAYTANITVDAVNDPATIAGTTTGTTTKDTQLTASGVLTVQDPDAGEAALAPQSGTAGSYGTFSVAANGLWSYALDNANAAVQALAPGDTLTDGFTVQSVDATATQTVTVTISGQSGHPPQLTPAVQVFGVTDGIFTINGVSEPAGNVLTVIQQSDGKLVGGLLGAFGLMRLNADGTLDASFGGGDGITTIPDLQGAGLGAWDVVQSSDGKLVATGPSVNSTTNLFEFTLARFESDGTPDATFGGGDGITTTGLPTGYLESFSLVEQTDGKFVVAGRFLDGAGGGVALARYNTDGSLDASFGGGDGIVTTLNTGAGPGISSGGQSLALQKDGKLVVAGSSGLGLVRYNADGSLDTSFGDGDGIASLPLTTTGYGEAVIQQSDGKIVVGGYASDDTGYVFALARYNADGSPDTTFGGGDGVATTALTGIDQDFALTVIQQSDGKLVLGGHSIDGDSHSNLAIARFNGDGSLDADFGSGDGFVETPVLAVNDHLAYGPYGSYGRSLVQQSDGKLILAGGSVNNWISGAVLVRYNPDGSLDSTFGDPGMPDQVVTMGVPFSITIPPNLFTDPDGDALTHSASGYGIGSVTFDAVTGELSGTVPVGYTDLYVYVTATDSTGLSAYDSFHITITQAPSLQSGIVRTSTGAGSGARSLIEQSDGKLVAAGNAYFAGDFQFAVVRYNANGSLDTSFGGGDGIVTTAPGYNNVGQSVIQQADGKLVVAGGGGSYTTGEYELALVRYNADGSLDASFGDGDGVVTKALGAVVDASVIQQGDGRLVVATSDYDYTTGTFKVALMRYNTDGSQDTSFGGGDGIVTTAAGALSLGQSVIQQIDGKLVIAGHGSYEFALVRYNADGSLDMSFGDGDGVVTTALGGPVYDANVIQQADGKLVVAGSDYDYTTGTYQVALVRYNTDGSLDTSFGGGDGIVTSAQSLPNDPQSVVQQIDGKLVVTATTYDALSGAYDLTLIRYNSDGSMDAGFGEGGIATARIAGTNELAYDVVELNDGKLAVSGGAYDGTNGTDFVLARFNPDGSLDTTFGGVSDQSASAGAPYSLIISPTLFRDPEGGTLTYSVTQSSGDPLPAWLGFNAATGLLSGTPPVGSADLSLRVIATDPLGAFSYVDFNLGIADTYVFGDGFGPQVLTGFTPGDAGADMIDLFGVTNPDWSTFADVQGALSQQGEDAFIDLGNGNSITLVGVAASALNSADFVL